MNIYYEKRPEFRAAQFIGTNSVDAIMKLCSLRDANFRLTSGAGTKPVLELWSGGETPQHFSMNESDWFVSLPDYSRVVMTNEEFTDRFEIAQAVIPRVGGLGILNDQLYRNDGRSPGVIPPLAGMARQVAINEEKQNGDVVKPRPF